MNIQRQAAPVAERHASRPAQLGVDSEFRDEAPQVDDMIRRYFTSVESEVLPKKLQDLLDKLCEVHG